MISFNTIPSNLRVPLAYIEFDNTRAVVGTPAIPFRLLVLGQMLATGNAAAGVPVLVTSADQAEALFGRGSMLAAMFAALKANDRYTESWAIPLSDDVAAVAAGGSILLGGLPTEAGTLNLYIAGKRVRIAVAAAATPGSLAIALAAAINLDTSLPVTAAVDGGVPEQVNLTARNKGEVGNTLDVRVNYYQGEVTPKGLTTAVVAMAGGAGNPDLTDAIAAMGDEWYQGIITPYTDAANLVLLETELADRWGGTRQIDGLVFTAFRGTHGATSTFSDGRNSPHVTCIGTGISPTPPYLWAAAYAGQAAASLSIDPARPLQTLVLAGVLPPAIDLRWTQEERNLLLFDGIATHTVDAGGQVRIEREVTMYQVNAFGVEDPSYLDVTTPATLSYLRYSLRARITQKFPRHKLADDGTNFGPGQAIVTPSTLRAELIALAREWETAGLIENLEQYKQDLIVERNANDRNRADVLAPPDLVNQLRIFAAQVQFIL
ncbi:phage tail sheath subtilisin-like domain-containing protein [Pseudomonas sp.]|uniref:phage tail sheath subtilisin-like domain-containing protein n=1 Tax=Pseudomonas sp. TaxID=306 RepID=UPI003D0D3D7B